MKACQLQLQSVDPDGFRNFASHHDVSYHDELLRGMRG